MLKEPGQSNKTSGEVFLSYKHHNGISIHPQLDVEKDAVCIKLYLLKSGQPKKTSHINNPQASRRAITLYRKKLKMGYFGVLVSNFPPSIVGYVYFVLVMDRNRQNICHN